MSWISNDFRSTILHTLRVLFVWWAGGWVPGDGFSSVGARTGAMGLAMAGT